MRQFGWAGDANEALQNDQEVVFESVRNYGIALKYASEAWNDKEVVLAAVTRMVGH